MIYFVQAQNDSGAIKIGTSEHVRKRMRHLALELSFPIRVLATVEGGHDKERELHGRFAHHRVYDEWFMPADELLAFIRDEAQPWDNEGWVAKRPGPKPNPPGTLVRVTDEFADALRDASSFEKLSMAEYATVHLLPIVQRRFKDAVVKKAKRMEEEGK